MLNRNSAGEPCHPVVGGTPYRQTTSETALLGVDVQNDVMAESVNAEAIVTAVATLVTNARRADIPAIWVQHSDQGLPEGSDGWRIVLELEPATSSRSCTRPGGVLRRHPPWVRHHARGGRAHHPRHARTRLAPRPGRSHPSSQRPSRVDEAARRRRLGDDDRRGLRLKPAVPLAAKLPTLGVTQSMAGRSAGELPTL